MISQTEAVELRSNEARSKGSALKLIAALLEALQLEDVTYCHWKSNDVLHRSATGENDLDLLVLNDHAARFVQVLCQLNFKQAQVPDDQSMPGVLDYYGYDDDTGRVVHVHAHFRLVIGDDRAKNYHLPVERAYLAERSESLGFAIPNPNFEFVVFVIRMKLKHCCWDAVLAGKGRLSALVRSEFEYLRARVDSSHVNEVLSRQLPFIDAAMFSRCVRSLEPGASLWSRMSTARQLQKALDAQTHQSYFANVGTKAWRRIGRMVRRRTQSSVTRRRLSSGGAIIAIVGGDGAGKSTAVNSVESWLGDVLATQKCHLGRPRKSWTTNSVRAILKIGKLCGFRVQLGTTDNKPANLLGHVKMFREVCRARDRYRTFVKARRFANRGGIVICDRFPLSQIKLMDNARIGVMANTCRAGQWSEWLRRMERAYYDAMLPPELLLLLRLDPEIAVRRKTDEGAAYVHTRSSEIWRLEDSPLNARVVDASQDKEEVLAEIRRLIWMTI